jgi:hypothetical protein
VKAATDDQIDMICKWAYNQAACDMQCDGVKLMWEQVDDLGDQVIDWMCMCLGLKSSTSDSGITFKPDPVDAASRFDRATDRYYIRIKTAPHQQWMVPSGWSWANLEEAKRGARKADAQWMAVELVDGETGKKLRY